MLYQGPNMVPQNGSSHNGPSSGVIGGPDNDDITQEMQKVNTTIESLKSKDRKKEFIGLAN